MNENTKLEIAKEVIAGQVGKAVTKLKLTLADEELVKLIKLKEDVDKGDEKAINHVLKIAKSREV